MTINWKNTTENLAIILVSVLIGVFIGYKVSIVSSERMLESQKALIEQAIKKETTAIYNEVNTEIKKIKSNKSGPIEVVIDPTSNSQINQVKKDSIPKEKTSFFKRLFNGKN